MRPFPKNSLNSTVQQSFIYRQNLPVIISTGLTKTVFHVTSHEISYVD